MAAKTNKSPHSSLLIPVKASESSSPYCSKQLHKLLGVSKRDETHLTCCSPWENRWWAEPPTWPVGLVLVLKAQWHCWLPRRRRERFEVSHWQLNALVCNWHNHFCSRLLGQNSFSFTQAQGYRKYNPVMCLEWQEWKSWASFTNDCRVPFDVF